MNVILATSQPSIAAAWRVTKSVPVIGRMVDDPVTDGMAQSLARPGGNVTGVYTMTEEMNPKRGAVASCVGIRCDAISGISRIPGQAARSIGGSIGFVARVCQPSTLRMLI